MVEKSKNVFLQALIITIIVFAIGIIVGFNLESNRVDKTELALLNSEVNIMDEQVRNLNIGLFNVSCGLSVSSTFDFADRIYQDALLLEEYDSSNKFTNELQIIHKKYDLLRMMLWAKSIEIKKTCPQDFHTVVYFFDYKSEDINTKARQSAMSRLLADLKNKHGSGILLIPIAANLNLESVNLVLEKYEIKEIPAIIVDERKVVKDSVTFEELESIVFENNNYQELEGKLYEIVDLNKQKKIMLNANR